MRRYRFRLGGRRFKGDLRDECFDIKSVWYLELAARRGHEGRKATTFKRHLHKFLNEQGMEECGINAGKWDQYRQV